MFGREQKVSYISFIVCQHPQQLSSRVFRVLARPSSRPTTEFDPTRKNWIISAVRPQLLSRHLHICVVVVISVVVGPGDQAVARQCPEC